jgi:hypothetical protein
MIMKSLIAAAAFATIAATASAPAQAKVNVDVFLGGFGPGYYVPAEPVYRPVYRPYYPVYEGDYRPRYYGISCEQGRREVRASGFRNVRALECGGRSFTYRATRGYNRFIITVSRRSGNILSVRERY